VLARALVLRPDFIVADEPVSMLDVSVRAGILNVLREVRDQMGLAAVFISHDLALVRYVCARTLTMYLGAVVEDGPTADIVGAPLHPYTKALLSAVPEPDPALARNTNRIILQGDVPSPSNPPKGCNFCTRCPAVMDICKQVEPEYREVKPRQFAACHLYNET
jgi:oligopeptide transport system ATP-binding protein